MGARLRLRDMWLLVVKDVFYHVWPIWEYFCNDNKLTVKADVIDLEGGYSQKTSESDIAEQCEKECGGGGEDKQTP